MIELLMQIANKGELHNEKFALTYKKSSRSSML